MYLAGRDVGPELLAGVAADEREDLERLFEDVGQGDLGYAQAPLIGQNARAVEAVEVLFVAVGLHAQPVQVSLEGVQVVARETPGEETAGKAGPGKKGHPLFLVPGAVRLSRPAADAHAEIGRA